MPLQQAPLALRCLWSCLHSLRRQFHVRLAVCPTMGGYRVAEPPSAHSPGTRTRFGRARGSIEATVPVLIQC